MICIFLQTFGCVITHFAPLQTGSDQASAPILTLFAATGHDWNSQASRGSQAMEQAFRTGPKLGTGGHISSVGSTVRAPRAQQPAWRYNPKKSYKYHSKKSFKYQRRTGRQYTRKKSFKYHPRKKGWKYNPKRTWKYRKAASGSRLREL